MKPDVTGVPISPLTGILDVRSMPDEMAAGTLRMRQNFQSASQNKLRRGCGWLKLLSNDAYNNEDFHDQLLSLSNDTGFTSIRQPVTLLYESESTRKVRSLIAAKQGSIAKLDEYSGNWRILGTGYGGDQVTSAAAPRFKCAQVGDFIGFTNDFNKPLYHRLEDVSIDGSPLLQEFVDFESIGLTRAAVVWSFRNCLFFADVEMDGERFANRILWSDFDNPTGFDPADVQSISGDKDLNTNERILAGRALGNSFLIYTTHGIWEMAVVGGDQSFAFARRYNGEENEGAGILKYPNTLVSMPSAHAYLAEDGVYVFSPYYGQPERAEWLHRATPIVLDDIDTDNCQVHVATFHQNEMLISTASAGAANNCPDRTLRTHMTYRCADKIDFGFTAFTNYRSYRAPTVRDFIVENAICTVQGLADAGYPYVREGLPSPGLLSTAPFIPKVFYTAAQQTLPSTALQAAKVPTTVARASGVATITVVGHGYSTNDIVMVSGISDASFNTPGSLITVTGSNTFTYSSFGPDVTTTNASAPTVRKIDARKDAVVTVETDGVATAKCVAHGLITGDHIQVFGKLPGNTKLNSDDVAIAKVDADTFTYVTTAVKADTSFGAGNIPNLVADAVYVVATPATGPSSYGVIPLVTGAIYKFTPGANSDTLFLTPITLSAETYFVYDGGAPPAIGPTLFGPVGPEAKPVTAILTAGLAVVLNKLEAIKVPTSVSRNDILNPTWVTITLAGHGYSVDDTVQIKRFSDPEFNFRSVDIVARTADTFSYIFDGPVLVSTAPTDVQVSRIVASTITTEDWTQPASDSNSLCALLGNKRLDDFCRKCDTSTLLVAASSQDWCLKQIGGVFYRERCVNPAAVGTADGIGYHSSVGNYLLDGYDSILRPAPMFSEKMMIQMDEMQIEYLARQVGAIGLRIGIASQVADPNTDECRIVWYQHKSILLACLTNRTAAEHLKANTIPSKYAHWKFLRKGRVITMEINIRGVGCDADFSGLKSLVKTAEADRF